jgi:hypothetical protein
VFGKVNPQQVLKKLLKVEKKSNYLGIQSLISLKQYNQVMRQRLVKPQLSRVGM